MTRTVVVGLDGASWDLIEPWIADGRLPSLATIRTEGTWARSRSCLPPVTFPNWKCYSASKNPGKLGVFWFEHIDLAAERIDVMNGSNFETAEYWDYLNDEGYRTGVINMPTMYPPRSIDGPVVCGGPDAVQGEYRSIDSGYTSPPELESRLEAEYDYQVHPEPLISSNEERGAEVEAILDLLDLRFEVALDLLDTEDLDLVHVTLFYLNVLQHFFWNETPTRRAWERIDEWLGRIDEREATNLIVMSDHGCAPTSAEFYINEWLAANGYLTKRRTIEDYLGSVGLDRETVLGIAKRFGLVDPLATIIPEQLQKLIPQSAGVKRERKLQKISLEDTKALASGQGPIYLNPDFDIDSVQRSLIADLKDVTDRNGDPLFDAVYRGDEAYSGSFVDKGPEIVLDQRDGIHVNDGIGGGEILTAPDRWAAENTRSGIFAARGPDFTANGRIDEIDIRDIAPTILATYDTAIPTDMDGTILSILRGSRTPAKRSPITIHRDETADSDEVAERLQDLGYME